MIDFLVSLYANVSRRCLQVSDKQHIHLLKFNSGFNFTVCENDPRDWVTPPPEAGKTSGLLMYSIVRCNLISGVLVWAAVLGMINFCLYGNI